MHSDSILFGVFIDYGHSLCVRLLSLVMKERHVCYSESQQKQIHIDKIEEKGKTTQLPWKHN